MFIGDEKIWRMLRDDLGNEDGEQRFSERAKVSITFWIGFRYFSKIKSITKRCVTTSPRLVEKFSVIVGLCVEDRRACRTPLAEMAVKANAEARNARRGKFKSNATVTRSGPITNFFPRPRSSSASTLRTFEKCVRRHLLKNCNSGASHLPAGEPAYHAIILIKTFVLSDKINRI